MECREQYVFTINKIKIQCQLAQKVTVHERIVAGLENPFNRFTEKWVLHYRGKGQDIAISASAQPRRHSASCVQNNRFKTLQPTEFTITELSVFWIYYKRRCCVFRSDGALHQHPPCRPLKKELFHLIQWWETGINLERHFRSPLFLSK